MDRFFVSYNFEQDMFLHPSMSIPNPSIRQPSSRRFALVKHDEIKALAEKASKVHVNIDITRYVRDIVVGIRTHPRVKGGLTARCSQDLVTVTKYVIFYQMNCSFYSSFTLDLWPHYSKKGF